MHGAGDETAEVDAADLAAAVAAEEGIPAVCFGPWAENVRAVDERVNIPSMVTAAQVLAVLIRDWCGVST